MVGLNEIEGVWGFGIYGMAGSVTEGFQAGVASLRCFGGGFGLMGSRCR